MIKNKLKLNKNKYPGFMVGLSVIIVTVILVLTISISMIVLRNINKLSTPINSIIAYNLADSTIRCMDAINSTIGTTSDPTGYFKSIIPIASSTAGAISFNNTSDYPISNIKCLGASIFENLYTGYWSGSDSEAVNIRNGNNENATSTLLATTTISPPFGYENGGLVSILIKTNTNYDNQSPIESCVDLKIYSTTTAQTVNSSSTIKKLFNATGRVPCTGNNVSRTIVLEKTEAAQ